MNCYRWSWKFKNFGHYIIRSARFIALDLTQKSLNIWDTYWLEGNVQLKFTWRNGGDARVSQKFFLLELQADWSEIGEEKKELNKFDGSLTTLPSSIRWISSWETSLSAVGNRGFRFFQKILGVVALEAESEQKRLIATRFRLVTKFLCPYSAPTCLQ